MFSLPLASCIFFLLLLFWLLLVCVFHAFGNAFLLLFFLSFYCNRCCYNLFLDLCFCFSFCCLSGRTARGESVIRREMYNSS